MRALECAQVLGRAAAAGLAAWFAGRQRPMSTLHRKAKKEKRDCLRGKVKEGRVLCMGSRNGKSWVRVCAHIERLLQGDL